MRTRPRRLIPLLACFGALFLCRPGGAAPESPDQPGTQAAPSAAESASAISEARLISAALDSVTGLVAEFSQTVESAALPSPQIERGTVYLLRPGRMRFEYAIPPGKLAIADGQRTWLYLPEERQALVAPAGGRAAVSGMGILLQERIDLVRQFTAAWEEGGAAGGQRWLELTPRSTRAEYRRLLVRADDDHMIRELAALDPLGGRITYRFSRLRRVERLDPNLFRFVPPRGVFVQQAAP